MTGHYADIASDLSAFHRIDDPEAMPLWRYIAFAHRLGAYGGVMTHELAPSAETLTQTQNSTPDASTMDIGGKAVPFVGTDTPPEVVAQLQRQALAARYGVDASAVQTVSTDRLIAELGA